MVNPVIYTRLKRKYIRIVHILIILIYYIGTTKGRFSPYVDTIYPYISLLLERQSVFGSVLVTWYKTISNNNMKLLASLELAHHHLGVPPWVYLLVVLFLPFLWIISIKYTLVLHDHNFWQHYGPYPPPRKPCRPE